MKRLSILALAMAATGVGSEAMATNTATLNFTATINQGNCDVTTTPATTLALGTVDPATLLGKNQQVTANKGFTVNLACSGLAPAGAAPKVTLSGAAMTGAGNKKLFRDSTSTSQGFGVAIAKVATATTAPAWADLLGNGDSIPGLTLPAGGTPLNIQMAAAVACGSTADCAAASLQAGTLSAAVTFSFAYK